MNKATRRLIGLAGFVFLLVIVSAMISCAYFLTSYIYQLTHLDMPGLPAQLINSLLGLLLVGTIIGAVGKMARSWGWLPETNAFRPILDALERIAQGDFSIRVGSNYEENGIISQLASSVNKMALELDQMEVMRQEFISNVSHEIQSPLTSIRGFARALENPHLSDEERRHYLSIIEQESMRLSRISDDLLKLASLEGEQARFEARRYRLDKQIRTVILACEPQWSDKSLDLDVALEEAEITADEDLLSQVWLNLLHNSIKFTPAGGRIAITLNRHDGRVEFSISDTGIGISEEDQVRVFERFYKADKSRTHSGGGSGLGLSIVRKIVEIHKGEIRLESRPGKGTTFTVSLPQEYP